MALPCLIYVCTRSVAVLEGDRARTDFDQVPRNVLVVEPDRTIMVVSSNKHSPTVLPCLYLIKRAWNRPNSSNSCGKHRECYYRRPDNQDICLQYLCYQTTA
ncbi:hypothetical protein Bbelb_212430 [Branchiostoma belcheri]|nr:hypothetical protein Bbelb_212430 [Branchiostoma belcheri]